MISNIKTNRAATPDGAVTLQASSHLMDDYIYATDLTADSDISVAQAQDGKYRLFYLGAGGNVMSLRQDPDSDTGWTEEPLNGSMTFGQVCGAIDADGTDLCFAQGPNEAAPDLSFSSRSTAGTWSPWTAIAVDGSVPSSMIVSNFAAFPIAGTTKLFAILAPTPGTFGPQQSLWTIDYTKAAPVWSYIADTDQNVLELCSIAGTGASILYANTNQQNPITLDLFTAAAPFSAPPAVLASAVSFTDLAVGVQNDADKSSAIVISDKGYLSGTRQIQYLDGSAATPAFVRIDNTLTVSALAVTNAGSNPMSIFALDAAGILQVIASEGGGQWTAPEDLALPCTSIMTGQDPFGAGELLYMTAKGLNRLWQSPDAEGHPGAWTQEDIEYEARNQTISEQQTYATTFTLTDDKGARMSNQAFNLNASEIVSANVAGLIQVIGPNAPLPCVTDGAGQVRLTVPADSLNTCVYSVNATGLMNDTDGLSITPNAGVQNTLSVISTADLLKIIPAQFAPDVDQVQTAIHNAMAAVKSLGPIRLVKHRAGVTANFKTPIAGTPSFQPFRFSVCSGRATFQALTLAEAAALTAKNDNYPLYAPNGLFDFFEDVAEAISDAVEDAVGAIGNFVADYVVTPILDGIQVAINFVIDNVTFAFKGIVKFVEDAFRVVENVFNAVLTVFEDIYNFLAWLLSDARKDIWTTKNQIEQTVKTGYANMAAMAGQAAQLSPTFFADIETQVQAGFARLESLVAGMNLNDVNNSPVPTARAAADDGPLDTIIEVVDDATAVANWCLDKITSSPLGGLGISVNVDLTAQVTADITAFFTRVSSIVSTEIQTEISAFMTSLEGFAGSASNLGAMSLNLILEAVKDLIMLVLKVIDGISQAFLQLIANDLVAIMDTICSAPIDNWLIKGIYNIVNPGSSEDVTLLGLTALLCAFPATTVYKIIYDEAPFRAAMSVKAVQSPALIMSGIIEILPYTVADIVIDASRNPTPLSRLVFLYITPLVIEFLATPTASIPPTDNLSTAKFTSWVLGFGAPALVLIYGGPNRFATSPRGDPAGSSILTAFGAATLAVNIWQLTLTDPKRSPADWVLLIGGPLSGMAKLLGFAGVPGRVALCIVDGASDLCLGIGRIVKGSSPADQLPVARSAYLNPVKGRPGESGLN
jgi:hypothetical protein